MKYEQQKQKNESEYSSRYAAEQRVLFLEQAINGLEKKLDETSRKYQAEVEMVIRI